MADLFTQESFAFIKNDELLMKNVLKPYFDHTTYLKSAEVHIAGDPAEEGKITGKGWFEIPESCYVADTGHFNSVEFNISYNQLMYYMIAVSVKHDAMQALSHWTLDNYFKKQLPDVLIVDFKSRFKKPLSSRRFYGEIDFVKTQPKKSNTLVFIKTLCHFSDEPGNMHCEGEVDLAIVNANIA